MAQLSKDETLRCRMCEAKLVRTEDKVIDAPTILVYKCEACMAHWGLSPLYGNTMTYLGHPT